MESIGNSPELNYMTQIVLLLFEDMSQLEHSDSRYQVDLLFSPGVKGRQDLLHGDSCRSTEHLKLNSEWVKRRCSDGVTSARQRESEPLRSASESYLGRFDTVPGDVSLSSNAISKELEDGDTLGGECVTCA